MAQPIPIHKVCKNHGELTEDKRYYYKTSTGKTSFRCKPCMSERNVRNRKLHPEYWQTQEMRRKHAIATKNWEKNNPDKVKARRKKHAHKVKEWYEANKHTEHYRLMKNRGEKRCRQARLDHYRELDREQARRNRETLSDRYMNKLLSYRGMKDIYEKAEIRNYLRVLLMLKRKIRERKQKEI